MIHNLEVDIILGFDLFNYVLEIIINRCLIHSIPNWSRLGRLRDIRQNKGSVLYKSEADKKNKIQLIFIGRLICDINLAIRHLNFKAIIQFQTNDDLEKISDKFHDFNTKKQLEIKLYNNRSLVKNVIKCKSVRDRCLDINNNQKFIQTRMKEIHKFMRNWGGVELCCLSPSLCTRGVI